MQVNSVVQEVMTKNIPIKNGPRAGSMGVVYTVLVDGMKINYGFNKPPQKGELINVQISDSPNRFGEHTLAGTGPTTTNQSTNKVSGFNNTRNAGMDKGFPIPKNNHAISICRQNALAHATSLVEGTVYFSVDRNDYEDNDTGQAEFNTDVDAALSYKVNKILEVANVLSSYTTGHVEDLEE